MKTTPRSIPPLSPRPLTAAERLKTAPRQAWLREKGALNPVEEAVLDQFLCTEQPAPLPTIAGRFHVVETEVTRTAERLTEFLFSGSDSSIG